jgi:HEAT repeat protein
VGHDGFLRVSWVLLLVFAALSLLCFVLLVVIRSLRDALERRRQARAEVIRARIFDLLMGEEDEAASAREELVSAQGRRWEHIEDQLFAMLPKLKGDSRAEIVSLLLAQGAEQHAVALASSRSAVRRCRGAHQLGQLGLVAHLERLVDLLGDGNFVVRRVAVRALGALGDARAVRPLLLLGEHDSRLTRDLVYALDRLGPGAAEELRTVLSEELDSGQDGLHLDPAAAVLGLIGDRGSVGVLARGLESEDPALAGACAEALGRIGSPESIPPLVAALVDFRPNVRAAAAQALGAVGSSVAIDSLIQVVDEEEPQVSRQAAQALLALGPAARRVLAASTSQYAVEALALEEIRVGRS